MSEQDTSKESSKSSEGVIDTITRIEEKMRENQAALDVQEEQKKREALERRRAVHEIGKDLEARAEKIPALFAKIEKKVAENPQLTSFPERISLGIVGKMTWWADTVQLTRTVSMAAWIRETDGYDKLKSLVGDKFDIVLEPLGTGEWKVFLEHKETKQRNQKADKKGK